MSMWVSELSWISVVVVLSGAFYGVRILMIPMWRSILESEFLWSPICITMYEFKRVPIHLWGKYALW